MKICVISQPLYLKLVPSLLAFAVLGCQSVKAPDSQKNPRVIHAQVRPEPTKHKATPTPTPKPTRAQRRKQRAEAARLAKEERLLEKQDRKRIEDAERFRKSLTFDQTHVGDHASNAPAVASAKPEITLAADEHRIKYEVSAQKRFSITYMNAEGGVEQLGDEVDEWTKTFNVKSGAFLSLSAQNKEDYGVMFVRIYVDGEIVRRSESKGGYTIASCNYSIP